MCKQGNVYSGKRRSGKRRSGKRRSAKLEFQGPLVVNGVVVGNYCHGPQESRCRIDMMPAFMKFISCSELLQSIHRTMSPLQKRLSNTYSLFVRSMLCILISKWVLCMPLAGSNHHILLCILNSKLMLVHALTWLKTIKNALKLSKKYFFHIKEGLPALRCYS